MSAPMLWLVEMDERTAAEGHRMVAWLDKHWTKSRECPICGSNEWAIVPPKELRQFNGGNLAVGGPSGGSMPVIAVLCQTCAYINLFSALQAGVVDPDDYQDLEQTS